jgi:hypothetical protein
MFCIFLCLEICYAYGQITTIRENYPSDDYQFALGLYNNAVKNQELVFTGSEYKAMTGKLTGHPYFDFDHFVEDTIVFDGMIFPDIPLQYDIVKDELVIIYVDYLGDNSTIQLRKDEVNSFHIDGNVFINVADDTWNTLAPGYYNLLYKGEIIFLKKIKKRVLKEVDTKGVHISFKEIIKYIIVKYNKTHHITSKKSLFKALDDKEKELSTYAREEKLQFKQQKEEDMINLIEYYDQITH